MDETTTPMAGTGEVSVTSARMKGSPVGAVPVEPVDHAKVLTDLAKKVKSTVPLGMSDDDAKTAGREIESRYLPPPPAPSVLEQLEAMKNPPPTP